MPIILATLEVEMRRIEVIGQPRQKVSELSQLGVVAYTYHPRYAGVPGQPRKKLRPCPKNN
jgi:hypothetical protein